MPNNKQAKKRLRQDERRCEQNKSRSSAMKNQIKKTTAAFAEGELEQAREQLKAAMSKIDLAAKKNIIHKNTAARRKSALSRRLLALEKSSS